MEKVPATVLEARLKGYPLDNRPLAWYNMAYTVLAHSVTKTTPQSQWLEALDQVRPHLQEIPLLAPATTDVFFLSTELPERTSITTVFFHG